MKQFNTISPEAHAEHPSALLLTDLTYQLYRESCRSASDIQQMRNRSPEEQLEHPGYPEVQQILLPLPPPLLSGGVSLQETLQARASERFYAATPVPLSSLSTLLYHASKGDRRDWSRMQAAFLDLQFCLVAWRVEGLMPAVYQYHAQGHALQKIHDVPGQPEEAENLVLQREFAYAPVLLFILGNLSFACATNGARGHRELLLRAGAAGQRLWFAALGQKLVGTVFAGFLAQAGQKYLQADGYTRLNLLAFACGYPFAKESV